MKKIGFAILIIIFGAIASPWGVYMLSLNNINGFPTPIQNSNISKSELLETCISFKEKCPVTVKKLSPYTLVSRLFSSDRIKPNPGERIALFIAHNYNHTHIKDKRMLYWHFSGAALTIWLTRNWTTTQILVKAKEIIQQREKASNKKIKPTPKSGAVY